MDTVFTKCSTYDPYDQVIRDGLYPGGRKVFRNLNPEDVEQMSVLKDAASTAVYGARAANGITFLK